MTPADLYMSRLTQLSSNRDPMAETKDTVAIRDAVGALRETKTRDDIVNWLETTSEAGAVLGLSAGLTQERLKNLLRVDFDTTSWRRVIKTHGADALLDWFEEKFQIMQILADHLDAEFRFEDILIARARTRSTAAHAGETGRDVEDAIEDVIKSLGLPYGVRTRFTGRGGRTAPADVVIPDSSDAEIVIAAKGFDSTGSKLSDTVRELEEMAEVRLPRQLVLAVVDGIGWRSRQSDLRKIVALRETQQIDGVYTLADLDEMRALIDKHARIRGIR